LARRSDHSRSELKSLVVETATEIIATDGLKALTTRKIASAIGYSPGSIYNVVDDLDALIAIINENTMRSLNAELSGIVMTGNELADAKQVLEKYLNFRNDHKGLWNANLAHAVRRDFEQPASYVAETEISFAVAARAIGPAFNGDEVKVQLAVRVLWASLQGIFSLSDTATVFNTGRDGIREMAENLVETYLRGIRND
jgi:AcrR family transcriptional regulator